MQEPHTESGQNTTAALEALLFLHGEPLGIGKIALFLGKAEEEAKALCEAYAQELQSDDRGLVLIEKNGTYQLATKPQFGSFLESFIKESLKEDLTPAALETLSLIAYFGPLTRAHIDFVRGVNSSFILRNLLIRGLIERKLAKGNSFAYEVTFDFLRHVGLSDLSQLPKFAEFQDLRKKLFPEEEQPAAEPSADANQQMPIA